MRKVTSHLPPGQYCFEKVHFQPPDSTLIGGGGRGKSKRESFQRKSACVPTLLSRIAGLSKFLHFTNALWTQHSSSKPLLSLNCLLKYHRKYRKAHRFNTRNVIAFNLFLLFLEFREPSEGRAGNAGTRASIRSHSLRDCARLSPSKRGKKEGIGCDVL